MRVLERPAEHALWAKLGATTSCAIANVNEHRWQAVEEWIQTATPEDFEDLGLTALDGQRVVAYRDALGEPVD